MVYQLLNDFERSFDPWRGLFDLRRGGSSWLERAFEDESYLAPINMAVGDDKIKIDVQLPGGSREDLEISVEEKRLSISGKRVRDTKEKDGAVTRSERQFGEFARTILLPYAVESEKADATFRDGILSIVLPRAEASKARTIDIKIQ